MPRVSFSKLGGKLENFQNKIQNKRFYKIFLLSIKNQKTQTLIVFKKALTNLRKIISCSEVEEGDGGYSDASEMLEILI